MYFKDFQSRWLLVLISLACVFLSCRQTVEGLGTRLTLQKEKLSNGLTLIFVEDHTLPVVSYQTWFKTGSVDEVPGLTGMNHLFEHLLVRSTTEKTTSEMMKGVESDAFAARDYTVFHDSFTTGLKSSLTSAVTSHQSPETLMERVIAIGASRMAEFGSFLNEDQLNVGRFIALEERRLRIESNPEAIMQEALWQLAYRNHPYHFPVIGNPGDLKNFTVPQVMEYFNAYFQPANATIIVVGDFNSRETETLIKKYYGPIPSRPRPRRQIPAEWKQNEERRLAIRESSGSERLVQAYHITAAQQTDSYVMDVLSNILVEGADSRLVRRLIKEKEIAEGVSGSSYTPTYPGLLILNVLMKGKNPSARAEEEIARVMRDIQDNGVTDEELQRGIKQVKIQLLDGIRTPFGLAQFLGTVHLILEDPTRASEDLEQYSKVKKADIQRVAQEYLNPNNRSVVTWVNP